jgi:hypothetical protein
MPWNLSRSMHRSLHSWNDKAGLATRLVSSKKTWLSLRGMAYMKVGAASPLLLDAASSKWSVR